MFPFHPAWCRAQAWGTAQKRRAFESSNVRVLPESGAGFMPARARTPHGQFFMLRGAPRCMADCQENSGNCVKIRVMQRAIFIRRGDHDRS